MPDQATAALTDAQRTALAPMLDTPLHGASLEGKASEIVDLCHTYLTVETPTVEAVLAELRSRH